METIGNPGNLAFGVDPDNSAFYSASPGQGATGVLTTASFMWQHMAKRSNSLAAPVVSHILADLGIITAAWLSAAQD